MWDEKFENLLRPRLPFLESNDKITDDTDLVDLGLDSLGVVDLFAELEAAYEVRFTDEVLVMSNFATPGTLWKTIESLR